MKEFYETYKVYLTRKNLEIAALVVIILSALMVFLSAIPGKGVLTLDKGGDTYTGNLVNGSFSGYGKFKSKDGWTYEGQFVNGQPEGKGTLTTEANVVYKGTFKQGIYQNAH